MNAMNNITIVAGPCAVESYEQTMKMAEKIARIRDIAEPFGIGFMYRGGAWKPRTSYVDMNGDVVFEGMREEGLKWLAEVAKKYNLSIVTECMSENDIRHFGRYLDPSRDYLQIGARNSQNFALLYAIGGEGFGVVLKNPQHGVDPKEARGSIERLEKNRHIIYCVRGQKIVCLNDIFKNDLKNFQQENPLQHQDARNLNDIEAISELKCNQFLRERGVQFCYDASHTWGGATDEMRRKIGEYAIRSVTEFGYDWIMLEVNDKSKDAKCDADQALLTTRNGVDWSQTHVRDEPSIMPYTLVDITSELIRYQREKNGLDLSAEAAFKKLGELRWAA